MSGSGREVLSDVQEWSGGPPVCKGVVARLSWIAGSGREAPPLVREWSRCPRGCPAVGWRPSRMSVRLV